MVTKITNDSLEVVLIENCQNCNIIKILPNLIKKPIKSIDLSCFNIFYSYSLDC